MSGLAARVSRLVYRAPNERETCPACGSGRLEDLDLLELREEIRGRRTGFVCGCVDCGLVFANPLPAPDAVAAFYTPEGEWGRPRAEQDPAGASSGVAGGVASWRFDAVHDQRLLTEPRPGARVLDFGCGEGEMLDVLQPYGWETFGIETATDRAFRRHQRLTEIPAEPAFDLVILSHVLEHLVAPLDLLERVAAASRPGAHLLVSVPRFDTLPEHRDYKYVINGRAHVVAYTRDCLATLLIRAGWQPVGRPPAPAIGHYFDRRLRMFAERREGATGGPPQPLDLARAALGEFRASLAPGGWLERSGRYRSAARLVEARRAWKRGGPVRWIAETRFRLKLRTRLRRLAGIAPPPDRHPDGASR